jgi:hypothetical protein
MRFLRGLIVFVFMFAAAAPNVAQAAAGEKVGFIRLLSGAQTQGAMRIKAQQAYQRMAPKLAALKRQGAVLDYEPDLAGGFVKVRYADNGRMMSALGAPQVYGNIQDASLHASPAVAQPRVFTSSSPQFELNQYDSCFSAFNLDSAAHVIGAMRDTTGRIVTTYDGYADGGGFIDNECFSWAGSYSDITPGYSVSFKVYDSTPTLLGTYTATVPLLSFTRITRSTGVVMGTGPASKPYQIIWQHINWDAGDNIRGGFRTGMTTASGTWAKDMTPKAVLGGDLLELFVAQTPNMSFAFGMTVPAVYCVLGGNYCELTGFPLTPASLSVVHAGTTYSFSGTLDKFGSFPIYLENAGTPVFMRAGDTISATNVATYPLPVLSAKITFSTNVVTGKAPASRFFVLWVYLQCGCSSYSIYSHADSLGNYSSDFTSQVDLLKTDATSAEVYYMDRMTGNITDYFRSYAP